MPVHPHIEPSLAEQISAHDRQLGRTSTRSVLAADRSVVNHARSGRWSELGAHMGYTSCPSDRDKIAAAIDTMLWARTADWQALVDSAAARAVIAVTARVQRSDRCVVATVDLSPGRRLIGIGAQGARTYVLSVGHEAIHVLTEPDEYLHQQSPSAA